MSAGPGATVCAPTVLPPAPLPLVAVPLPFFLSAGYPGVHGGLGQAQKTD